MPKIYTNYFDKSVNYEANKPQRDPVNIPGSPHTEIRTSANDTTRFKTEVVGSIIYANTTKPITPKLIFDQIKKRIPEIVGNCGVTDEVFLELLRSQIALLTAEGNHKWNFLAVEQIINLNPGKRSYKLPDNYDQMIAVWFDRDNRLNDKPRKVELIQLDSEKKNFIAGVNYFEVVNNVFKLINFRFDDFLNQCGECGVCQYCQNYQGPIHLHYHIVPQSPETMEERIMWFPSNPKALEYIKEKLIERIYQRAGQAPYISPDASIYFNDLMKWDSNYFPINNKSSSQLRVIDFRNIHNKRARYLS